MEIIHEGRKYLEPNRCEAPNSVPKKESEHPFRERVFKHLPLLTNVVTVLTVLGGTGCAEVFAHRPLPGEIVVVPNTGGGNPKPGELTVTPSEIKIVEPHTLTETLTLSEDLYEKINLIQQIRSSWKDNEESFPTPALSEIFDQIKESRRKLQNMNGEYSMNGIAVINNIYLDLTNAPAKDKKLGQTVIYIDPEAKQGEMIAQTIKELLTLFPNYERGISNINIVPREGDIWKKEAGQLALSADGLAYTYKDQGAKIVFPDRTRDDPEWPRKILLQFALHEFAHGISLYSGGYNLQFLSPVDIINLIWEDTQISNMEYENGLWTGDREQNNAYLAGDFLGNTCSLSCLLNPEIKTARINFINKWFSKSLGADIDIIKNGKQLNIR